MRQSALRCAVVLALSMLGLLFAAPSWAADGGQVAPDANGNLPAGWKNTQWGPYGPLDQALLENVRRADLWEGEGAAVMGMQKGNSERVREVGKLLNEQHAGLEAALQEIAPKLQVTLPTQPNADQQTWLGEMSSATGEQFDQIWVDRLRAAHGKIYSLIATVRANTRNSLVRKFAEAGNTAVSNHMSYLESTGLVKYNELPLAATAAAPAKGTGGLFSTQSSSAGGLNPMVVFGLLGIALVAGGAVAMKVLQSR